ncbi:MAG: M23 family metallopeptidase [Ruminococcus sp.]|nr:M23 family metallopeptidase [Ruminococcus sp.]
MFRKRMRYNKRIWKRLLFGIIFSIFLMKGIDSEWNNSVETAMFYENEESSDGRKEFIKWVDFKVTAEAMNQAYQYDRDSYSKEVHLDWIDLLAILGAKYGGDFQIFKSTDMKQIAEKLISQETTVEEYAKNMKYFTYYKEAYSAVLGGMVGKYKMEYEENGVIKWKEEYGLKAFHPIAKGFPYSHYDDFGAARTYGYRRQHLGHDLMGQVGTPIIAVESGKVTALGWNQYGGWRIGIESFDGLRYYYYAHLRQNRPYAEGLEEGDTVQAGDVIGYMGRTGYSTTENVNNIDNYHLHFGIQLIFDESQREGNGEIWISCYEIVKFLQQNCSQVQRNDETKEWSRVFETIDL